MTEQSGASMPVFRGSEDEVLAKLWTLCYGSADNDAAYLAVAQIQGGNRSAHCDGQRFEVIDPELSIEQDVYGCERGRDCTGATPTQRAAFEAMIAQLEAGS